MLKLRAGFLATVMACLLGFATLTSCNRPETEVGLDYAQDDLLGLSQTDTLTLRCRTVREDSLQSNSLSTAVLGRMYHPDFGWHTAGFVTQFRLSAPDIDFGSNPQVDSVYLSLRYTGDSYGQLSPQHINVYQLEDSLQFDSTYYSNHVFAHSIENLADPEFQPITLNQNQTLYFANDTVNPEVRVYLNDAFGQQILEAGTDVYDSNEAWNSFFHGLHIAPDPFMGGEGAVGIDMISGLSYMRMHYHNDADTAYYDYIINPLSARSNLFTHEWQGPFQGLSESFIDEVEAPLLGVFSGAGLKTQITLPHLAEWKQVIGENSAIHKAELWLPVDPSHNDARYPIPNQLFILTENALGEVISTPDQSSIGLNINGNYDAGEQAYRFNISQTMQRMLNSELDSDLLHVVASRAGISLQGVAINGPSVASGDSIPRHSRLVVTWSD